MNSVYLILATVIVAVLGFVFWVIVTRDYDAHTVGLAATLLSVSGLLSLLSLAGFDTTFVRFLPKSKRRNDHINSGLIVVTLISIVLSLVFVLLFPLISPGLAFVAHNPWYLIGFVFFTAVTALNTLTNSILLAFKDAQDIFIINLIFSVLKIALPLMFIGGSAMAIFVMVGISQLAGLILSLVIIRAQPGFTFSLKLHLDILRVIRKYSLSVYAANILNLLPPTLLPLIVLHHMGADNAAYYYMAFTIASLLYTISYASMQSAFAESSYNEMAMKTYILKAAKLVGVMLVPAILITIGLSNFILKIFGDDYALNGRLLLELFAISAISVAVYSAIGAVFKVTKNLRGIVIMNIVYSVVILSFSYWFIPSMGLIAIGWAWLLGNVAAAMIGLAFLKRSQHKLS